MSTNPYVQCVSTIQSKAANRTRIALDRKFGYPATQPVWTHKPLGEHGPEDRIREERTSRATSEIASLSDPERASLSVEILNARNRREWAYTFGNPAENWEIGTSEEIRPKDAAGLIVEALEAGLSIEELQEEGPGRYEGAGDRLLTIALQYLSLGSSQDDSAGDTDHVGWGTRFDRFLLRADSQGFLWTETYGTEEEAKEALSALDPEEEAEEFPDGFHIEGRPVTEALARAHKKNIEAEEGNQ